MRSQTKSQISHFIQFLIDNLNKETGKPQIESLNSLQVGLRGILEKTNLKQIKDSIRESKENVLNVIKLLEDEDIKFLKRRSKNISITILFANVFKLSKIYKKLDKAKAIPDEEKRRPALWRIFNALVYRDDIAKAKEVANLIPDTREREMFVKIFPEH